MAAIFGTMGGLVGFISAVVSFTMFKSSLLMALAIWSGVGLLAVFVALALAMAPRSTRLRQQDAQAA